MDLVLRTTVMFVLLFGVTRIAGRRTLASFEPFDFILLIVLGDLIQQGVTQNDQSLTGMTLVIATLTVLSVGLQWSTWRSRRVRQVLEPEPLVLVEHGEVIQRNLDRERMTLGELLAEARLAQIGSLDGIEWAVLERNGRVSFLPREASER
jgi:uncharacterized membrane protein YcaP (DUF421 family)